MKKDYIIDGNEACALGAYLFSEICGIYPITPASPMATLTDKWSAAGKKNLFNDTVKVVEMQSEAGAAAVTHGALQAGCLGTTFTASQGLLLMIPTMYKMAGEMLPGVIHVAARSLATHALSIFGDHQDIYATRSTGFCMLSSSSVEEAYYMSIISHLSAIEGSLPFLHFFDGFRTSHELNKVSLVDEEEIRKLIDYKKVYEFKNRALNIGKEITRGTSETGDVYFQNTEVRNKYYNDIPNIVKKYMDKINTLAFTDYKPFNYYGKKDATHVIVAMGSVCSTIKTVVDILNKKGYKVGMIEVHLYRPFSTKYLLDVLPKTVDTIAVLDRTKEPGSTGEPLYLDVMEALKKKNINIYGGIYGLSSKDVPLKDINAVFKNILSDNPKNNFTIGIKDDVTHLSLEPEEIEYDSDYQEIKVYGFGSDGMVGASKNFIKVLGEIKENYVQGYFEYDSKKSGGTTISHLRVGPSKIEAPYFLTSPDFVVVSKDVYLNNYYLLKDIKQNGTLLISSDITDEVYDYLEELSKRTDLVVEIGLQTIHEKTAKLINRGHSLECFNECIKELRKKNINVVVHIINGLPYESKEDMIETIKYVSNLDIQGIKIHMLFILKGTELEKMYNLTHFHVLTKEEYIDIVCDQLEYLREDIVVNRITGDPIKELTVEPKWLFKKFCVLNDIDKEMVRRDSYQGIKYNKNAD